MPLGATSLLAPVPTKKMGFTIESLVGGGTTPPKSDSGSPPLRHHSLTNSRMFPSEIGADITRDRFFTSDNSFNARELQSGLLFHRDIMALQRQQQEQQQREQQQREQMASECIIREQLFLRHRAQIQEQLNHQEQMKRNSLGRELIHQEISRELLNSRIHSDFDQQRRSPNCENAASTKQMKSSPRTTPRGSPRSSPSLPQTNSSPQSFTEEDRRSSASPISNNNNIINRSSSPLSSLKKHQSSSPNLISPSGLPPHSASSFLNPLQHPSMLPNLPPQFLPLGGGGGGPSPIHIPTPMMQHHLLGGGLPQGLGGNLGGGGLGGGLGTPLPAVARDFPLYPWLISARHGRVFPPGFPGQDGYPGFLLPFRKPKRIRTAFSPSQLLKLEQAFEKNQYVVGQERKQLAQNLNLSETQVKVWFQNRRTKHKRQQQEDEEGGGGKGGSEGDKSAEEGLIIEHEEEDEELDVLEEAGEV